MTSPGHMTIIDAAQLPMQRPQQRRGLPTTAHSTSKLRSQHQQQYIRDLYEFKVERNNGLPVSLSCTDTSSSNDTATTRNASNDGTTATTTIDTRQVLDTTILFDYELTLRDPDEGIVEVLRQDLPKWEFFLLYYVAEDIGIVGCQKIGQQNITTSNDTNSATNSSSVDVINLSSFGSDVLDTRVSSCEFLVNLEPGYICIPLKGTMTAVFVGYESDRPAVEAFLAYHVATVVNHSDFLGSGVNQTSFIGSRVIPSPQPVASTITDETRSRGNDSSANVTAALASSLTVAAVFFMFLIYFVVAKRGPRRADREDAHATETISVNDLTSKQVPIGSEDALCDDDIDMQQPQQMTTNPTQSSTDTTSDKSDDARCGGSLDSSNRRLGREDVTAAAAAITLPSIQAPYSLINTRTVSTVVSTDDSGIYIEDDETTKVTNVTEVGSNVVVDNAATISIETPVAMTDALPPKHPTGPTSKTLLVPLLGTTKLPKSQRKRRKKKKKKAAKIVRSSSRENMKEMETITEVEEETSGDNKDIQDESDDDDDDEGSWCSTSDSDPGSRDPSPARSRDPSPARSTGSSATGNTTERCTAAVVDTLSNIVGPSADQTIGTDKPKHKSKKPPSSWV